MFVFFIYLYLPFSVSPCDDEPCNNDGVCIATGVDAFQCICEPQCYIGPACEIGKC